MNIQAVWIMGNIRETWTMTPTGKMRPGSLAANAITAPPVQLPVPGLESWTSTWDEHRMAPSKVFGSFYAMNRHRSFHHPPSAASQPLPSNPTGIQIHWQEGAGIVIKIQLRQLMRVAGGGNLAPRAAPGSLFVTRFGRWAA